MKHDIDQVIRDLRRALDHALLVQASFPRAYREDGLFVSAEVLHAMCDEVRDEMVGDPLHGREVYLRAGVRVGPVVVWRPAGHRARLTLVLENVKESKLVGQAALLEAIGKITEYRRGA